MNLASQGLLTLSAFGLSLALTTPSAHSAMPKACVRAAKPSAANLGLAPKDFLKCVELMLKTMKLPPEAKRSFQKDKSGVYQIKDYMAVAMKTEGGSIASMDVFFFNKLRKAHGMGPELAAQWATLAVVFPSAKVDPREGRKFFKEIDAIGRKTNKPVIQYNKDGVALNASFMPVSVRYRFKPQRKQ